MMVVTYISDIEAATARSQLAFLQGKSVLVAGATGLIGSCIVDMILSDRTLGVDVYAMGRNKERAMRLFSAYYEDGRFHFLEHDICLPIKGNVKFDYIIHAASEASPEAFSHRPVEVIMSNVIGLKNLLDYGRNNNMNRLLYVSSAEVYGENQLGTELSEDDLGNVDISSPRSSYPQSKRLAETLCASYIQEYATDIVIARPCHVFGPCFTEKDNRAYAQFIQNVLEGKDIVLKSQGSQKRQWCYVVDCAEALMLILRKGERSSVYNVADRNSVLTIRELACLVAEIGGRNVVFEMAKEEERRGYNPVQCSLFSTERIERLGWSVSGNIREKLEHTISYARERQPD